MALNNFVNKTSYGLLKKIMLACIQKRLLYWKKGTYTSYTELVTPDRYVLLEVLV